MTTSFNASLRRRALVHCIVLGLTFATAAWAGPGHDHGDEAPAAAGGSTAPRVTAHSDLFELVGIVEHDTMTIYLDRYASNEPVRGAQLEVEAGEAKGVATEQDDGSYVFRHAVLEKEGNLSITFTVTAGSDVDLLAGDAEIGHHDEHEGEPAAVAAPGTGRLLAYAGGALALLAALAVTFQRLRASRRDRVVAP